MCLQDSRPRLEAGCCCPAFCGLHRPRPARVLGGAGGHVWAGPGPSCSGEPARPGGARPLPRGRPPGERSPGRPEAEGHWGPVLGRSGGRWRFGAATRLARTFLGRSRDTQRLSDTSVAAEGHQSPLATSPVSVWTWRVGGTDTTGHGGHPASPRRTWSDSMWGNLHAPRHLWGSDGSPQLCLTPRKPSEQQTVGEGGMTGGPAPHRGSLDAQ